MSFYFLTKFFKYFFRVLHEASSSWLKFVHAFQNHPVFQNFVLYQYKKRISQDNALYHTATQKS
jgi:hypothetical protein